MYAHFRGRRPTSDCRGVAQERLVATRQLQGRVRACDGAAAARLPPSRGCGLATPAAAAQGRWVLLPHLDQRVCAARDGEATQGVHRKGGDPRAVDGLDLWLGV